MAGGLATIPGERQVSGGKGVGGLLRALGRVVWRDLQSYNSLVGNNFFLFVLLVAQQLSASLFFALILGLLLLFPLSADPLAKVPRERLEAWPITRRGRVILRLGSLALSPAAWITVAIVAKTSSVATGGSFLGLAVCAQAAGVLGTRLIARAPAWDLLRWIPRFPGRWGGLVSKDLRQMLRVLDFYLALLLSLAGIAYRLFSRHVDYEAFPVLAVMVVLALSTYGQCLFGLDLPQGWVRYRLLPLRGWQVLLAKDTAFIMLAMLLVVGLDPVAGFASAVAALAVGHHASVYAPVPQKRWRFTGGTLFPTGLLQAVAIFGVGVGARREGWIYLAPALAAWIGSVWFYGLRWDTVSAKE
jgi:hypothetical protein